MQEKLPTATAKVFGQSIVPQETFKYGSLQT